MEDINRLILLLVEKTETSKWQSEQLGITRISKLLKVGVEELYDKKFLDSV